MNAVVQGRGSLYARMFESRAEEAYVTAKMDPLPPDDVIAALLSQEQIQELLRRTLAENDIATPLEQMSPDAQASLLSALISESVVTIGPGQEMPMLEFLERLEAEEDESGAEGPNPQGD